jgi:hypothetical protein
VDSSNVSIQKIAETATTERKVARVGHTGVIGPSYGSPDWKFE